MEVSRPPTTAGRSAAAARLRSVLQSARKNQHEVLVQKVVSAALKEEAVHGRERSYVVSRESAYRDRVVRLERNMRWLIYSRRFSEIEDGNGSFCFGAQVQIPTAGESGEAPDASPAVQPEQLAARERSEQHKRCIVA